MRKGVMVKNLLWGTSCEGFITSITPVTPPSLSFNHPLQMRHRLTETETQAQSKDRHRTGLL